MFMHGLQKHHFGTFENPPQKKEKKSQRLQVAKCTGLALNLGS